MAKITEIRNAFNHADCYEKVAVIQEEIGERLLERLSYIKINPRMILDLGCGTGLFSQKLKQLYPKAKVVGVDLAENMLKLAQKKQSLLNKWSLVQGNMQKLPFAAETFDLIFTNQAIHWSEDLLGAFTELNRVMSRDGCLMFTTLGQDTFIELRQAFLAIDNYAHVNDFLDMHDVGDALLKAGFLDPVVDMEHLTAHYRNTSALLRSLKDQGVRNIHQQRRQGLMGRQEWLRFEKKLTSFCTHDGKCPLTYEVVYGHAWNSLIKPMKSEKKTLISLDKMKELLRIKL